MKKQIILILVGILAKAGILTPIRVARLKFWYKMHRWPDFEHPRDVNEKINWMKFYGDTSLWPTLADKYAVREYVAKQVGGGYFNTSHWQMGLRGGNRLGEPATAVRDEV